MKKVFKPLILVMILALLMTALTGCFSKKTEELLNDVVGALEEEINNATASDAPTFEFSEEDMPSIAEPDSNTSAYSRGVISGQTYESAFLGLGCTVPDTWYFYDDSELAEVNGIVSDHITDEELREVYKNSGVVFDMFASSVEGPNVNITLTNLESQAAGITAEEYVDIILPTFPDQLIQMGYTTVDVCEKTYVNFAGSQHVAIALQSTMDTLTIYQYQVILTLDTNLINVTLTAFDPFTLTEMLSYFYAL